MRECRNHDLQDLLPDFVAGLLGDGERERVMRHLAGCDACQADTACLRAVRAARPTRRALDVPRIVAALPRPRHDRRPARMPWVAARWGRPSLVQAAAAVAVMLAGGLTLTMARRGSAPAEQVAAATPTVQADVTVSFGRVDDPTDAEWQLMLDKLEQWDGATSAEPLPSVSLVSSRGGNTQ